MTNRVQLLLYLLPVLAAGLVIGGLARLVMASQLVPRNPEVLRKVKGIASHEDVEVDVDDYVAIRPSCFFRPRAAPTLPVRREGEPPRAPARTGMSAVYVVRGIVVHSDPTLSRVFIEVPGVSEQKVYACGEEVHGSKVVSISKDAVVLRRGEEDTTLALRYEDEYADGRRRPDSRSTYSRAAKSSKFGRSSTSSRYGSERSRRESYRKESYRGPDPRTDSAKTDPSSGEQERIRLAYEKQREREREKARKRESQRIQETRERESRDQRNAEKQRDKELMRNMSREERIQFLRNRKLEKKAADKKRR